VEFADLVLLNKTDLVSAPELAAVRETVAALSPAAEVVETTFSAVDPDAVLGRDLFDPAERDDWERTLARHDQGAPGETATTDDHGGEHSHDHDHDHDHDHPEAVYGVESFVYRRRRPFHPERFADLLDSLPGALVRSKGTCWVGGRNDRPMQYSQAGPSVRVEASGRWIASLPETDRRLYRSNRPNLDWDDDVGDRRTELVFIGRGLDQAALVERLDACLVPADEWDRSYATNPFPDAEGETVVLAGP
jgi:G3E family GTPase